MEVKAHLRHLRISPRKVRLVADVIRGMDTKEAQTQLEFISKRASQPILKLLNSAVANAENNFNLEKDNLYISKIFVNEGPILKRWRSRAMGKSSPIYKRTSHITIILDKKSSEAKNEKVSETKEKIKEKQN